MTKKAKNGKDKGTHLRLTKNSVAASTTKISSLFLSEIFLSFFVKVVQGNYALI